MKNSKILWAFFLSSLVLYNTLKISFTYIYYNLDPIGFVEKLCENKDKPALECNGKCHLKKVTQTTQDSEKIPLALIDFKDILLYNTSISAFNFSLIRKHKKNAFYYLNKYTYLNSYTVFHPPKV